MLVRRRQQTVRNHAVRDRLQAARPVRVCPDCGQPAVAVKPGYVARAKAKYCAACRQARRRQPRSRLTPAQAAQVLALRDTCYRHEIARRVGVSLAQVSRFLREQGLSSNARNLPAATVAAVLRVYEQAPRKQGKQRVRELFPDVAVRSVVERYRDFAPRQRRWQAEELREAVQMAGLVRPTTQARYFARPHAATGSIKSVWAKVFQCAPRDINGLGAHLAWRLTTPGCPAVLVAHEQASSGTPKVLWLDLAQHLRPDLPEWVHDAVQALAGMQAWVHGTTDSAAIRAMITEREETYGVDHERHDDERRTPRADAARPAGAV